MSIPMLTGNEKRVIAAILFLLVMGGIISVCRHRAQVADLPVEDLPSLEDGGHRG